MDYETTIAKKTRNSLKYAQRKFLGCLFYYTKE